MTRDLGHIDFQPVLVHLIAPRDTPSGRIVRAKLHCGNLVAEFGCMNKLPRGPGGRIAQGAHGCEPVLLSGEGTVTGNAGGKHGNTVLYMEVEEVCDGRDE